MGQSHRTPVSEVIGNTESLIHRVIDIRRRAAELSEQAARLQEEAYLAAVRDLGTEDGAMAFSLACRGLGVDPALRTNHGRDGEQASVPAAPDPRPAAYETEARLPDPPVRQPVSTAPQLPAAPRTETAPVRGTEVVSRPAQVTNADPSKIDMYGVSIKRSKLAEAEEVVEQARRSASQNRKSNPYSDDRGRNAWRNTLFAAVLAAEARTDDGIARNETYTPSAPAGHPASEIVSDVFEAYEPEATGKIEDVEVPEDADGAYDHDPLEDDTVLETPSTPVARFPSRAVSFTETPVQQQPRKPDFTSSRSSPFSKPASPSATPEVHVDRPVQNRTVAYGQAVPMPKSFKDAVLKRDNEGSSSPTISPPPVRRAPSFVPRSQKD